MADEFEYPGLGVGVSRRVCFRGLRTFTDVLVGFQLYFSCLGYVQKSSQL